MMLPGGLFALGLNIITGRASDRLGRKLVVFVMMALCGAAFAGFYSGIHSWLVVPLWITAFYAFFTADSLMAGFALEIIPTAYRATVGGFRYTVEIMMGGLSLALEGVFYDHFHGHGPGHRSVPVDDSHCADRRAFPARTRGQGSGRYFVARLPFPAYDPISPALMTSPAARDFSTSLCLGKAAFSRVRLLALCLTGAARQTPSAIRTDSP